MVQLRNFINEQRSTYTDTHTNTLVHRYWCDYNRFRIIQIKITEQKETLRKIHTIHREGENHMKKK